MKDVDQWNGLSDLLANLIAKYAEILDIDSMPTPETSENNIEMSDISPNGIATDNVA